MNKYKSFLMENGWIHLKLFQDCKKLRSDIDEQHKIRMEAFEFKMQPIVINEEPSRKVSIPTIF